MKILLFFLLRCVSPLCWCWWSWRPNWRRTTWFFFQRRSPSWLNWWRVRTHSRSWCWLCVWHWWSWFNMYSICFRWMWGGGAAGPEGGSGDGEHPGRTASELLLTHVHNFLNIICPLWIFLWNKHLSQFSNNKTTINECFFYWEK